MVPHTAMSGGLLGKSSPPHRRLLEELIAQRNQHCSNGAMVEELRKWTLRGGLMLGWDNGRRSTVYVENKGRADLRSGNGEEIMLKKDRVGIKRGKKRRANVMQWGKVTV